MGNKIKGLFIGDGGCATGFARVNHSIIDNLPEDKYEIHHLAINYHGDPYESKSLLYPASLGGDLFGFRRVNTLIDKIKPNFIFILNDAWNIAQYLEIIKADIPIVTYFPVDAKPQLKEWFAPMVEKTTMVAYTEYGKSAVTDYFKKANVQIIPHGIDTNTFYPIDKNTARLELNGVEPEDFIFLTANRNQPRKRLDLTIKGFAEFVKDKPDSVKLYCHCGVEDMGWHIIKLCDRYNISHRLLLTSLTLSPINFISDERLNIVYNCADVGITNSMGEGWGLGPMEHAACGKPQIVTNCSALKELYTGMSAQIPVDHYETYPKILTDGAVVTSTAIAEAMELYYSNNKRYESDGDKIYKFVTQPKFSWKNIAKQWDLVFNEVLGNEYNMADSASS